MLDKEKRARNDASLANPGQARRQRAEAILLRNVAQSPELDATSPAATLRMLHELRVHQIELEMQNEELRRTQVALDDLRARYFDLYDLAPAGYCTVSETGLILESNLRGAVLLGLARDALVKQPISTFILKADQDVFNQLCKQLIETGKPQDCELRMVNNNGTQFWASLKATAAHDDDGTPVLRVMLNDVTERRTSEMRLRESQLQLQGVVESAMDAIITTDDESRVVLYNPAAARMFGVANTEVIGFPIQRLMPTRFRDAHAGHVQAFGRERGAARDIGKLRPIIGLRANGEEFTSEATISQIEIQGKKLYTVIMRDITERTQAEAALRLSHDKLRELVAYQERIKENERIVMAREIHDELGGALTGIKANISVAMDQDERAGGVANPRLVDACILLDAAVDTVREVIAYLRPSVLDHLGVWAALEWYAEQTEARTGLSCNVTIDASAAQSVISDERSTALFRILQETLTNVTRHANASQVEIRVMHEDGSIRMEVEDNGKGIDAEQIPNRKSWGIAGMAERARYIGGNIRISDTSHGTLVVLRLPLEKQDG